MDGMEHISAPLARALEQINPHRRTPIYIADGRRVMSRVGAMPCWLSLDEAERELFKLTALLAKADDPGEVLPLVTQLSWAIHDARQTGNDNPPTEPMAVAA